MDEPVDLYTAGRERTGRLAERYSVLPDGLRRYVVHVCIFDSGRMLIQKRVSTKRTWPGYWDVSVGGGVDAGEDPRTAATRETKEELGIDIDFSDTPAAISLCSREVFDDMFVVNINGDTLSFTLQKEEVEEVMWVDEATILRMISEGEFVSYNPGLITYLFHIASCGLVMYGQ